MEGAVLDAIEAYEAARIAAEENGTGMAAWGVAIDEIAAKLAPGSPLAYISKRYGRCRCRRGGYPRR